MPKTAKNGNRKRENELSDENLYSEDIHHAFNAALLVSAALTVHHDAGFAPSVDHKAQHPLRVLQFRTLEQ